MKEVLDLLEQANAKGGVTIESEGISFSDEYCVCTSTDETPVLVCEPVMTVSSLQE
jgi:hypothetical protein